MRCAIVLVVGMAASACTDHEQLLADRPDGEVYVHFGDDYNTVIVDVWSSSCRPFDHRLQAYIGDTNLVFDDFWGTPGDGCVSAHAEGPIELTGAPLALTLADPSDVWTVTFPAPPPAAIDVEPLVAGTEATIAWPDALPIVNGCVRLEVDEPLPLMHGCAADYDDSVRIDAASNTVRFDVPNTIRSNVQLTLDLVTEIDLEASPGDKTLPRCDGPAHCNVMGYGQRTLDVGITQ